MGQLWFFVSIKHEGGEGWFTNFSSCYRNDMKENGYNLEKCVSNSCRIMPDDWI